MLPYNYDKRRRYVVTIPSQFFFFYFNLAPLILILLLCLPTEVHVPNKSHAVRKQHLPFTRHVTKIKQHGRNPKYPIGNDNVNYVPPYNLYYFM